MPTQGPSDAVRRSSDSVTTGGQNVRRVIYDSLNERRLQRERIMASLLLCPGPQLRAEGRRV